MQALVEELPSSHIAESVFATLSRRKACIYLDSARRDEALGRYSFVACEPYAWFACRDGDLALRDGAGEWITRQLAACPTETIPDLPPFQGGAAGLFSYDLNRTLERIARPRHDEFDLPLLAVGLYDVVVAFDHAAEKGWIISQGWPASTEEQRDRRATRRLQQMRQWLNEGASSIKAASPSLESSSDDALDAGKFGARFATPVDPRITSNMSREQYLAMVRRGVELIHDGDVFQVNLAQRLLTRALEDGPTLYARLRAVNPAPFAGYFDLGCAQVCSASPERLIAARHGRVETRPIKGTRRRRQQPEADAYAGVELQASEKDRAENVMIVDLLRNDLSKICEPDSVQVTQLCGLESYQYVLHLVSAVEGRLNSGVSSMDLLRAVFPGGSISGAPKVRAMEIIAELEPTARGPYCGSLGYMGFDGAVDLSILIRTLTLSRGWWQFPVGGGIVAPSDPASEFEETWDKARGLIRALSP